MSEKAAHRPRGTGHRTVRVVDAVPGGRGVGSTGRLFIGRVLWQGLGEPRRVSIERFGVRVVIQPTETREPGTFAVTAAAGGEPRVSIGASTLEELGLDEGVHEAMLDTDTARVIIRLAQARTS